MSAPCVLAAISALLTFQAAPSASQPIPPQPSTPADSDPASEPTKKADSDNISAELTSAAKQRASFVYQLPSGEIWDSYYYIQFRRVLAEFDRTAKDQPMSGQCRAWGFKKDERNVSRNRPSPLWHCARKVGEANNFTPFVYVNTTVLSSREREPQHMFTVGAEISDGVFEFAFHEFPNDQQSLVRLPASINMGYASGAVRLPAGMRPTKGASVEGEYFLLPDKLTTQDAAKAAPTTPRAGYRLVHAQTLRISSEDYLKALSEGRAELVQWSFTRKQARLGEEFEWSKRVIAP